MSSSPPALEPLAGQRLGAVVTASFLSYTAVGWFLSGLGAILPDLEDDIGRLARLVPLFPGAILVVAGLAVVYRHRRRAEEPHPLLAVSATLGLGAAALVMGMTAWPAVSIAGAIGASAAAAVLVRILPGVLAGQRPSDTERVLTRANAWSSLAGICAPLVIGASIALSLGWRPATAVPLLLFGVAVAVLTLRAHPRTPRAGRRAEARAAWSGGVPPLSVWWTPWTVLMLSIVVEFCFAYFVTTFLHEERGLSTAVAAAGGAAWGIGMATGRFWLSRGTRALPAMPRSLTMIAAGFVLLWLVPSPVAAFAGIVVAGLGASPLYPTRMNCLLECFPGAPQAGSARGSLASGTALLAAPALMGALRTVADVRVAYLSVPVLLAVLAVLARTPGRTELATQAAVHQAGAAS
jgi:MFS family permease